MQLSDLLGVRVRDQTGRRLGTVTDVRLVVPDGAGEPAVFGLVISPRTASSYLGYERSQVRRPALLAAVSRWRHRGTFLALWADLQTVRADGITIREGYRRYSPALRTQ
ncbi:PRC-barrel domain-containing protein [Mycobacterium sp. NPDC003323]